MAKTVVGLYDTEELARRAADELKKHGFDDIPVHIEARGAEVSTSFTRDRGGNLVQALQNVGVPQNEAEFYSEGVQRGGSLVVVEAPDERADTAARLMNEHEPIHPEQREWSRTSSKGERTTSEQGEEEAHLTEAREELHVGKRKVEGGGARIHKRVKERPVEETVELHEEEVDVEERPASESTSKEDPFREETVEMKETREEPVVEKETKIEGEVVARKKSRERSETSIGEPTSIGSTMNPTLPTPTTITTNTNRPTASAMYTARMKTTRGMISTGSSPNCAVIMSGSTGRAPSSV